jgi:hypothetical protein
LAPAGIGSTVQTDLFCSDRFLRHAGPISEALLADMSLVTLGVDQVQQQTIARRFIEATEGLRLLDLEGIAQVMRSEKVDAKDIDDAVRRYKLGVTEDPWQKIDRTKLLIGRRPPKTPHRLSSGRHPKPFTIADVQTQSRPAVLAAQCGARGGESCGIETKVRPSSRI